LAAGDDRSSDILVRIVDEAVDPLVSRTVRRKLNVSLDRSDERPENVDATDLASEARMLVVDKLLKLRAGTGTDINDLDAYVRRVAANVCNKYLRDKYPHRLRLKNQLRYLLAHHPNLSSWQSDEGEWCCYFRDRADEEQAPFSGSLNTLEDVLASRFRRGDKSPEQMDLVDVVSAVMDAAGAPVRFADLVSCVYKLRRLQEPRDEGNEDGVPEYLLAHESDVAATLEGVDALTSIWAEIKHLPLRHRAALVLSLRGGDGESLITLLPASGVATVRQIAEALEMDVAQFALIWPELPWDDHSIARHLGVTRQQVINLRHWARVTLKRRFNKAGRD
jgi:hypothetical protein